MPKIPLHVHRFHEATFLNRRAERTITTPVAADCSEGQKYIAGIGDHPVLHAYPFLLKRLKSGGALRSLAAYMTFIGDGLNILVRLYNGKGDLA
jgi:hypothetical protein